MYKWNGWFVLFAFISFFSTKGYCQQQDVNFNLSAHLFPGKKILKIKRDFYDPYLWVLAENNEVYRVNTLNQAIDDYTAKFSIYNNFQFIDIAGRSADTVFIATNSPNIIQFRSGAIDLVGTSNGVAGTVNSIGIDYYITSPYNKASILRIATNSAIYRYNMNTGAMTLPNYQGLGKVYEASYRRLMYADSNIITIAGRTGDVINYLPVFAGSNTNLYTAFLWESDSQFGYDIHTAYFTPYIIYDDQSPLETDLYWGNAKGMWQISDAGSINPNSGYGHFLDGIGVNKITGIYGLTPFGNGHPFGNPGLIKENLLIGTDNGLYFSSSTYAKVGNNNLNPFSLFHEDVLGNVKVNDICVNAISTTEPICEDGVYVACDNGLYLLKPDYGRYLNIQNVAAARFKGKPDTLSQVHICDGSSVTAAVNDTVYTGHTFQWYKNGNLLLGQISDTLSISTAGEYYAFLYDPCENIKIQSNHLKVSVTAGPVFTFNYPDRLQYCDSTSTVLKTDNKPGYHYRWYINGTFNGDTTYHYPVTQSGKYKVEVGVCTNSWVSSKEMEVDLVNLLVPVIQSDKSAYCIGDNATLSLNVPVDPSYTINWYRDNNLLIANQGQLSIITTNPGNYSVTVTGNQLNNDGTTCIKTSAVKFISFDLPPTVSIQKIVKTTLCSGQTVDLKASYNAGSVKWSTGDKNSRITVSNSGTYTATVTTPAGCTAYASTTVQFFPNPTLNVPNTGICLTSHQAVTLTAPAGFVSYNWNGQAGSESYKADHPQTVTLTVTDANGCQSTQEILVADECPDVTIPNAFTPNGDGINDTWKIAGLEYDRIVVVRIFSRYGQQVYQSKGYGTAWNGEYQGKKLPAGVYYYIIRAKNGTQTYSGSLTILY